MQVTAYFVFEENFELATTGQGNGFIPLVAYLDYDSVYCTRACRQEILKARSIDPVYNRYHLQSFSTYHTRTAADYCAFLIENSTSLVFPYGTGLGAPVHPSPTSYFAFLGANQSSSAANARCPDGVADEPRCATIEVKYACTRNSSVGQDVRAACRATCGTCAGEGVADAIDWRARQRKHTCITYDVEAGTHGVMYQMHDMVCHPPFAAFALQDNLPYLGTGFEGDGDGYQYRSGDPPRLTLYL